MFGIWSTNEKINYPMELYLRGTDKIRFSCDEDLLKVIPDGSKGRALNFGQGEGQVEIDGTQWGFYIDQTGLYHMAFECGNLDWRTLNNLVEGIISAINKSFDVNVHVEVKGPFTNRTDI